MKITITNFGPIKQFDYDLAKDIVVTFGDNNIGKSYAMQVVYLLLKTLEEQLSFNSYYHYNFSARWKYNARYQDSVHEVIEKFSKGTQLSLNITELINSIILEDLSNQIIPNLNNSCENTFGNFSSILEQNPIILIKIGTIDIKISLSAEKAFQANLYSYPTYLKKSNSDFHKSRNAKGKLDIYYHDNIDTPANIISETIEREMLLFAQTVSSRIGKVYFLPASRSGIYSGMSAFSSIIAELSKNKAMLTRKIELPGISEPISDYFLMLSNIKSRENDVFSVIVLLSFLAFAADIAGTNAVAKATFIESGKLVNVSTFPPKIPYCATAISSGINCFKLLTTVNESIFLFSDDIIAVKAIGIETINIFFIIVLTLSY